MDAHDNPLPHLVLIMAGGLSQHTPARRIRYGLLGSVTALQDEDARTDRDYERVIAEYLEQRWGTTVDARLRAEAIANTTIGVVRAALIAWSMHGADPVASSYALDAGHAVLAVRAPRHDPGGRRAPVAGCSRCTESAIVGCGG